MNRTLSDILGTALLATSLSTFAQEPNQTPSSPEDIRAALGGGVPMGRWKEGLMFEGISPQPWLASAAIVIAGLQHGVGVRFGAGTQNLVVGIKLMGLISFLAYGFWAIQNSGPPSLTENAPVWKAGAGSMNT